MAKGNETAAVCRGRGSVKAGTWSPGCGARIRWPKNPKTGRGMPVDYDPRPDGNIAIEGGIAVVLSADRAKVYEGEKFLSHFATCPNAPSFRPNKPTLAPARPKDITLGTFDSPTAAAIGRISADAMDLTVERLTEEFCAQAHAALGDRPLEDELQHLWKDWQRAKRNMGVDPGALALVAKRAKAQLHPAEVTAA